MPRANRSYLPGHVWHITHRCHDRRFLLSRPGDRRRWRDWLATASLRYGVNVLDYIVTSNHVHLLVYETSAKSSISRLMQLVQGRTAQGFNRREGRRGAYWDDRHHAVAVEAGQHLWRCLAYIDLNMVRAGAVAHPGDWEHAGYHEVQSPAPAHDVVDLKCLAQLTGFSNVADLQAAHRAEVERLLAAGDLARRPELSEAIAVGSRAYTDSVRAKLGLTDRRRVDSSDGQTWTLRESRLGYRVERPHSNGLSSIRHLWTVHKNRE